MNKRVKKMWVAALRSGEYEQCRKVLRNGEGGFCCLGVLCDLYAKETGDSEGEAFDSIDNELAPCVTEWAGLADSNPILGSNLCATGHNDGWKNIKAKTFTKISNLIQRYL